MESGSSHNKITSDERKLAPDDTRVSKDGREFSLSSSSWQLNKDVRLQLAWLRKLDPEVSGSFLKVLAYYAENFSADHTYNVNSRACAYFKFTGEMNFDVDGLISYRSSLTKTTEHHLGVLRGFIRRWHDLGYQGISDEVLEVLGKWRLKGNEKGVAVSLMDPEEGPFTDIEMSALLDDLLLGYMQGNVSLEDYALISTLAHSGRRVVQILSLKLKDLVKVKNKEVWQYAINFPRAKQRELGWRAEFNSYAIVEDLWVLLELQSTSVIKLAKKCVEGDIPNSTLKELPLFPSRESFQQDITVEVLHKQLCFDVHHATRGSCNAALNRCVQAVGTRSERTGELLKLNSRRFRYTLGSNTAREGLGEYIIAEVLDHSDTQNASVYIRNVPDIVERIDKAVAMQLAPLAQAFQGVLIKSESEAIRGDDKASRVGNGRVNVGSCGSYGFCGALAPIACYTCAHFQPWLDGPHEEILDELLAKRDDVLAATKDPKVAAVNDRLILAVGDVILRCQKARSETLFLEAYDG